MKSLYLFLIFVSTFCFSQQTEEFRMVKHYYNQHRTLLNNEFKKKFDAESNPLYKSAVKNDFLFFMKKMDSIENVALIAALLKVKNLEDIKRLNPEKNTLQNAEFSKTIDKTADYPGGINALRKEVAQLFYGEGVYSETGSAKTNVGFIVEKDGTVSNVKAEGDNFTFNRQAEIAVYSISEKFSPAYTNGTPVRYRFRLPLALNFE
ncbi:energy transducer TonB [Chryseobacterium sp. RLHN22]|uniref:energy transducer TonB n=1 Tax=Chryseobacterium sp. RLHN22 TaxID=3437885 RepID=UPI003D9B876E